MDVVGVVVDLIGRLRVPREFDEGAGLKHGGEAPRGRFPCGVGYHRQPFAARGGGPQDGFRGEEQEPGGDMIVAGHDGELLHLRILGRQDIIGEDGVLGRGEGVVLHDHPLRVDALRNEPLRHFAGFRGGRVLGGRAASGTDDIGVRVLFGAAQHHRQPFDQLVAHGPVRLQLEPQGHDAKLVRIRQPVGQHVVMQRRLDLQEPPQVGDHAPSHAQARVDGRQLRQELIHTHRRLLAVMAEIHHQLLNDLLGVAMLLPFGRVPHGREQRQRDQGRETQDQHGFTLHFSFLPCHGLYPDPIIAGSRE